MGLTGSWAYTYTISVGGAVEAAMIAGCLGKHMRNMALPWLSSLTAFLFAAGAIAQVADVFAVPQGGLLILGLCAVASRPLVLLTGTLFLLEFRACRLELTDHSRSAIGTPTAFTSRWVRMGFI